MGVQVIGATVDKAETHRRWAARNDVRMPIIDDADHALARAFAVDARLGGVRQATFLIDADGAVRKVYRKFKAKGHAAEVLEDCRRIWG